MQRRRVTEIALTIFVCVYVLIYAVAVYYRVEISDWLTALVAYVD